MFSQKQPNSGADPRTGSWSWAIPHAGPAFLRQSFLVSHRAEGRQNQGGAVAMAQAEVWDHRVETVRGGERRLKPQGKECPGNVHNRSWNPPDIFSL